MSICVLPSTVRLRITRHRGASAESVCVTSMTTCVPATGFLPVLLQNIVPCDASRNSTWHLRPARFNANVVALQLHHRLNMQVKSDCPKTLLGFTAAPNLALNLAPFGRWTLRDKAAQRRLAPR